QQVTVMQGVPAIFDNADPGYSETGSGWTSYPLGYNGTVRYNSSAWSNGATASWQVPSLASGSYTVQASWNGAANHTTAAVYNIYDGNTLLTTVTVDQTQVASGPVFGNWPFQT